MKRTISAMVGKGSINHNTRTFFAENVDPTRTHLNIQYCNVNVRDVYHELFDEAVTRYNARQTRKDRCIDDYYEKISKGKQEKTFHELVMQIGNRDDCGSATKEGQLAADILDEYMIEFQKRNPTLKVFSAHLHMDESTPHLHIDFVPYTTGSKRGVDTRVSLKQALGTLGFKGGTKGDTEWNQWANSEKEQLALVMERYGIEWEKKGTHEEHLSVLEYKKQERAKEVAILTVEKEEVQRELEQLAPLLQEVKAITKEFDSPEGELLPEPGKMEFAKSYRDNKVIPFIKSLVDKCRSLVVALHNMERKYWDLHRSYTSISYENSCLREENEKLIDRVERLEKVSRDFNRVKRFFGAEKIEKVVVEVKEMEVRRAEEEKERRRLKRKKDREAR